MKFKLNEYLNAEIPGIQGKTGVTRIISFLKEMRYNPSSNAIFLLRYCYVYQEARGIRKYLKMHYHRLLVNRYGIYMNVNKNGSIGKGLFLPHPTSIVFGDGVNIGNNCIIYQNVTFGAKKRDQDNIDEQRYPQIGNDCVFYAGASIVGAIHVADGTQVGANAVLISDTEKYSIYAGVPAVRKS